MQDMRRISDFRLLRIWEVRDLGVESLPLFLEQHAAVFDLAEDGTVALQPGAAAGLKPDTITLFVDWPRHITLF